MKAFVIAVILLVMTARESVSSPNTLPAELRHVLELAQAAEVFSLEPLSTNQNAPKFHGYEILGHAALSTTDTRIATGIFTKAVEDGNGSMPDCFDPRHALHIVSSGHRYDLLLCYACLQLVVYKDDQRLTALSAGGSPKALNDLLRTYHIPISHSGDENSRPAG